VFTFCLCCLSWIFFRADSISDGLYVLRHSITGGKAPLQYCASAFSALFPGEILFFVVVFSLALLFLFDWVNEQRDPILVISGWRAPVRWTVYVCFMVLLLLFIPKETASPFIYFQF